MEIRPALAPYVPLARMLAQTFGQDCEVVLHDLDCPEHSVVMWKTRMSPAGKSARASTSSSVRSSSRMS